MQCLMKERWILWMWSRWEAGEEVVNRYRRCCWDAISVKEAFLIMKAWAFSTLLRACPQYAFCCIMSTRKKQASKKHIRNYSSSKQSKTSSSQPSIIFPGKRDHRLLRKLPWPRLASVCCRVYSALSHPEKQRKLTETQPVPPSRFLTYSFIRSMLISELCQTFSV